MEGAMVVVAGGVGEGMGAQQPTQARNVWACLQHVAGLCRRSGTTMRHKEVGVGGSRVMVAQQARSNKVLVFIRIWVPCSSSVVDVQPMFRSTSLCKLGENRCVVQSVSPGSFVLTASSLSTVLALNIEEL